MDKKRLINRENIYEHLIEYQFNLIDKTILNALFDKTWLDTWSLTKEQHERWKKYSITLMQKIFKFNRTKALSTFEWLNLMHGLKVK